MRRNIVQHQHVVATNGGFHRSAIAIPALRAAFDVGEDERDRAARYA
jgi:hypothetical protein